MPKQTRRDKLNCSLERAAKPYKHKPVALHPESLYSSQKRRLAEIANCEYNDLLIFQWLYAVQPENLFAWIRRWAFDHNLVLFRIGSTTYVKSIWVAIDPDDIK